MSSVVGVVRAARDVAARFAAVADAPVVAVRAVVALVAAVPVRVGVPRDAPPVARVAAARDAATASVVVRVDPVAEVDVVRDVTVRADVARAAVPRDAFALVVRAATAREEFPFDDPRDAIFTDAADVGVPRDAVVRFAIFREAVG